ncbi:hypothetical protein [Desulfuromonas sp.]|uniref:hypothetical protein n=1 Tax=Desulfuromonas sp. TaxID=892 RepID=UPI0025C51D51|nr:hypothetical protein [Desulfuromonas sp.]
MAKVLILTTMMVVLAFTVAFAHHLAVDMVDEDIYAMIDEVVGETPHALLFTEEDSEEVTTTITTEDVSTADDLIRDGLLDGASLLDGDVTITIEFPEVEEPMFKSIEELSTGSSQSKRNAKKWTDWGPPVIIKIHQVFE